jgi:hypothetical protein
MADTLNSFFIESVDDLLANNINYSLTQTVQKRLKYQMNTMFWFPTTELEVESEMWGFRG